MNLSINDIKKHLGPGLGLRKNRYVIEIPVPTISGESINILCQSAGLPERNINTVDVWHKGRRYTVRGETDFIGEYEISILDDDQMQIRKLFDAWMNKIDNTRPDKNSRVSAASFEAVDPALLETLNPAIATSIKNSVDGQSDYINFALGQMNLNATLSGSAYQLDINVWQMDRPSPNGEGGIDEQKVYGYKLQNAFPKSIGIVTLEDGDENTLSEFSVTFGFSEFIPLYGAKRPRTADGF